MIGDRQLESASPQERESSAVLVDLSYNIFLCRRLNKLFTCKDNSFVPLGDLVGVGAKIQEEDTPLKRFCFMDEKIKARQGKIL